MSQNRKQHRTPSYRRQGKHRARVTLNGKDIYLGEYDSPESHEKYHRVLAEWEANGRRLPSTPDEITVVEVIARYLEYADSVYRKDDGKATSEFGIILRVTSMLKKYYGHTPVSMFTPKCIKMLQQQWVETTLSRNTVNKYVSVVKRIFKWATSECLIDGSVYHALQSVDGLRRGRTKAPDYDPKQVVSQEHIDAVQPYVFDEVWNLIQLQLLCGARGGELVGLRVRDIDRSDKTWRTKVSEHKTAHHGKSRTIYFDAKARSLLASILLGKHVDDFLFSPIRAIRASKRKDAFGKRRDNQSETPRKTQRQVGEHYTSASYRCAVTRACEEAGISRWTPHRLRHTAADRFVERHGFVLLPMFLGHAHVRTSEIYAKDSEDRLIASLEGFAG